MQAEPRKTYGKFKKEFKVGRPDKHANLMRILDAIMNEHGLTKSGLARKLGMCRTGLWKIETKKNPPGWEFAGRLHIVFGIPFKDVVDVDIERCPRNHNTE